MPCGASGVAAGAGALCCSGGGGWTEGLAGSSRHLQTCCRQTVEHKMGPAELPIVTHCLLAASRLRLASGVSFLILVSQRTRNSRGCQIHCHSPHDPHNLCSMLGQRAPVRAATSCQACCLYKVVVAFQLQLEAAPDLAQ